MIGIIGGSGLYKMQDLKIIKEERIPTPFGAPSDAFILGELEGRDVAFLARHGKAHTILPTEINYRANIYGFKVLGVDRILSVSAVGSMKAEIKPGDVVAPLQFIDRTRHRSDTFFGEGIAVHVSLAHPVCPGLHPLACQGAAQTGARIHKGGVYLCMEGPQFSTQAESFLYRSWGVDVIGMTNLQEAKLCREAEICYATFAMVSDYDCWHEAEEAVTVDRILDVIAANARLSQKILMETIRLLPKENNCSCTRALDSSVITSFKAVPPKTLQRLEPILRSYRQRNNK